MAKSTCPMCRTREFEMVESKPKNSRFSVNFVQCSTCGTVVGVLEHIALTDALMKHGALLQKIAQAVKA